MLAALRIITPVSIREGMEGQTFLYLFDYGDSYEFDLTVKSINPLSPKGEYPRILEYHGGSTPQYPDIDEETGELSWDPPLTLEVVTILEWIFPFWDAQLNHISLVFSEDFNPGAVIGRVRFVNPHADDYHPRNG